MSPVLDFSCSLQHALCPQVRKEIQEILAPSAPQVPEAPWEILGTVAPRAPLAALAFLGKTGCALAGLKANVGLWGPWGGRVSGSLTHRLIHLPLPFLPPSPDCLLLLPSIPPAHPLKLCLRLSLAIVPVPAYHSL